MELQQAIDIMNEQGKYVAKLRGDDFKEITVDECNGYTIEENIIIGTYEMESLGVDTSKIHVFCEEHEGGEGLGEHYHIVFKIDHPEHGVGYIMYVGQYDSWNGTDWDTEPFMVKPVAKTIIQFEPV